MDNKELDRLIKKKTDKSSIISVGISWVDGRLIFKHAKKWGQFWYGVCNYSRGVWAITPLDYEKPTMLTTIRISPTEGYCDKAFVCLNIKCPLNRFNKILFLEEFKDVGEFSLSLPKNFGEETPWFNTDQWINLWSRLVIPKEGGKLRYNEEEENIGD